MHTSCRGQNAEAVIWNLPGLSPKALMAADRQLLDAMNNRLKPGIEAALHDP